MKFDYSGMNRQKIGVNSNQRNWDIWSMNGSPNHTQIPVLIQAFITEIGINPLIFLNDNRHSASGNTD
jgi:hypothetical protein